MGNLIIDALFEHEGDPTIWMDAAAKSISELLSQVTQSVYGILLPLGKSTVPATLLSPPYCDFSANLHFQIMADIVA